jgi:hypothetical protein
MSRGLIGLMPNKKGLGLGSFGCEALLIFNVALNAPMLFIREKDWL